MSLFTTRPHFLPIFSQLAYNNSSSFSVGLLVWCVVQASSSLISLDQNGWLFGALDTTRTVKFRSLSFPDEGTKIINKVDADDDPAKTCFSFLSLQFEMETFRK